MTYVELMKPENIDLWAVDKIYALILQLITVGVTMTPEEGDEKV
jgi:hypothetical protein